MNWNRNGKWKVRFTRYYSVNILRKKICIFPSFNAYFCSSQLVVYKRICLLKSVNLALKQVPLTIFAFSYLALKLPQGLW